MPQFGESAHLDVGELARFASTAEQLGADSLWVGDRLLAAVNPTVGYVGTDAIPEQFRTNLDPFIALAVAATATTTAQLGCSVFVAPWYPPPSYPPPPEARARGSSDGRAVASLLSAIAGIILGLPFGIPGMALGSLAYFLGKSAVSRIDSSQGTLGGRSLGVWSWVLGAIAMGIGAVVTLAWLVVVLIASSQTATGY